MKNTTLVVDESVATELLTKNIFYERNASSEEGSSSSRTRTNRPISRVRVAQYAAAMLRGEWKLTHQGIALDSNGNLVDGQHRLLALQLAAKTDPEISVEFSFAEDVDPEVFEVIDTGNVRSPKDILALRGERNALHLGAAVRLLYLYDNVDHFQWGRTRVTNHQISEMLDLHPTIREDLSTAATIQPIGLIATAGTVGLYVCRRESANNFNEFVDALKNGAALETGDPRLTFRNYLMRSKATSDNRRSAQTKTQLAMFIKTWNDYQNGKRRDLIRWTYDEKFPKPKLLGTNGNSLVE